MDNATKRGLKQPDKFISLTDKGVAWAQENQRSAIIGSAILLVVILLAVGGGMFYSHRSDEASMALGDALHVYQTPVATPGQQVPPGMKTFPTMQDRAHAANQQFVDVAHRFGMTKDGKVARYFAGITYMEEGQNGAAEDALKSVASSWNTDLSALAKLALAQMYHSTGRDPQAVALYQDLTKGHATTVTPGMAQIELAEMYESEGKIEDAKKIYAQLKDKDKEKGKDGKETPGPIGTLAAEKLNPQAAAGPQLQ